MKPTDITKKYEEIKEELTTQLETMDSMFKTWNLNESDYREINWDFLERKKYQSENMWDCYDIRTIISEYDDYVKENLEWKVIWFYESTECNSSWDDYGDCDVEQYLYAGWVEIKEELTERDINNVLRDWIREQVGLRAKALWLENYGRYTSVDCKLLNLFRDETIDFDTLVKLVYKNCIL